MSEMLWGTLEVFGVMTFSALILFAGYCVWRVYKDISR